jgi:DNA-binding IclR family transcriptional regulator
MMGKKKIRSAMQNGKGVRAGRGLDRNQLIGSVAGTLHLLEIFAEADRELPLGAFVEWSGRPKASVHRMLATLVNLGFLDQNPETAHYRQTLKLWRLGVPALEGLDLINNARPHLEALMRIADETVHLASPDLASGDVIYVSKFESPRSIRVQTQIGRLVPSWCTATGRAILAFNPAMAEEVLSRHLIAKTPYTETNPNKIREILKQATADGYVVAFRENNVEMGGIAAPVRDHNGHVIAACGVAVPAFRMDSELVKRQIPHVIQAVRAISKTLGCSMA